MTVCYETNDNKYIQARLMADEFTTDTTQWAIAEEGVYVENPEFAYVKTDADGKILWAIKVDGSIYYGAGVPQQIIDYINEKIADFSPDEYEDIVAFLADLEKGDETLQDLLDKKVDGEYEENPEYIEVKTDAEDKILEATEKDGTKVFGDVKVLGSIDISGVNYKVVSNPEWLKVVVDSEDRIICGIKTDGKTYVGDAEFLSEIKNNQEAIDEIKSYLANFDIDALSSITATESPEYIEATIDSEGKFLAGRTPDGAAFEKVGFTTPKVSIDGHTIENIEDPEGRSEITTDSDDKIVSYRDKDGVLYENVGIETSQINFVEKGLSKLMSDLKNGGFLIGIHDWSDEKFVEIPLPDVCSIVNIVSNSSIPKLDQSVDGYIEYWDKLGNYFKKPITGFGVQGDSSKAMPEKNYKFDLDDKSSIKFGDWVPQDSFHLKKYYMDNFRGQCVVAYRLAEQMYQTREFGNRKPYEYLYANNSTQNGNGKMSEDFFTGALCHPDGFPIKLYYNRELVGIYSFNLKKDRDNYAMSKKNTNNIILDGTLNINTFWGGTVSWQDFEIRNPKTKKSKDGWELVDINGNTYDGDHPKELMGTTTPGYDSTNTSHKKSADTKAVIERLAGAINAVNAAATTSDKKAVYETYFKVDECIDYLIFANVLFDSDGFSKNWIWCTWDGLLWSPTYYDKDSIFGLIPATGIGIHYQSLSLIIGSGSNPTGPLFSLYQTEIEARYKELRDKGVFTTENIVRILERWLNNIGYDNLKEELETTCPETPSYRADNLYEGWVVQRLEDKSLPAFDPTKTYQEGERCWYKYMTIIATQEIAPHPSPIEDEYSLYP